MQTLKLSIITALLATGVWAQNSMVRNPSPDPISLGTSYLSTTQTAATAGTTAGLLVGMDTSGNMATAATSSVGVLGVAASTQTTGQSVQVATRGIINCVADNSTTIGNLLGVGTTTAGRCKDLGATDSTTVASNIQIIGRSRTAVSAAANVSVQLFGPGHYGTASAHQYGGAFGSPGGSALTTGMTTYFVIPSACTINAWNILVDAGTATVKFWKIARGTAIPTSGNSINTSGVAISTGTAVHSTTVSDFTTTTVTAGDIGAVTITAVSSATFLLGTFECQ